MTIRYCKSCAKEEPKTMTYEQVEWFIANIEKTGKKWVVRNSKWIWGRIEKWTYVADIRVCEIAEHLGPGQYGTPRPLTTDLLELIK